MGKLSKYTDSIHTEVEDPSSRYMNASDEYDRCGHGTRQFHPSCIGGEMVLTMLLHFRLEDVSDVLVEPECPTHLL